MNNIFSRLRLKKIIFFTFISRSDNLFLSSSGSGSSFGEKFLTTLPPAPPKMCFFSGSGYLRRRRKDIKIRERGGKHGRFKSRTKEGAEARARNWHRLKENSEMSSGSIKNVDFALAPIMYRKRDRRIDAEEVEKERWGRREAKELKSKSEPQKILKSASAVRLQLITFFRRFLWQTVGSGAPSSGSGSSPLVSNQLFSYGYVTIWELSSRMGNSITSQIK